MVRVRYAPSPTGGLHLGGLRTALYNLLFAKASGGKFILRIEDTDRTRLVPESAARMESLLARFGIVSDEPVIFQSSRLPIYKAYADRLVEEGKVYKCICKPDRLERIRTLKIKQGLPSTYDKRCLAAKEFISSDDKNCVYRLNVEPKRNVEVNDWLRGKITVESDLIDDQVLMKSDGFPTYHFASVVDDHEMGITHVIRGDEWIPSTPKHVLLYEAFGWAPPQFIHLPLLVDANRQKLSKRSPGQRALVDDFLKDGYTPATLTNFVALLGWNPGTVKELYYEIDELAKDFDLTKAQKGAAVVDSDKLNWMSTQHTARFLASEPFDELREEFALAYGVSDVSDDRLRRILAAIGEGSATVRELVLRSKPFFVRPDTSSSSSISFDIVQQALAIARNLSVGFSSTEVLTSLKPLWRKGSNWKQKDVMQTLRLALTGLKQGPGVAGVAAALGKGETINRMEAFIK